MNQARTVCLLACALLTACGDDSRRPPPGQTTPALANTTSSNGGGGPTPPAAAVPGTSIGMDFTAGGAFYKAPFPDESRRRSDGTIDVDRFPNPSHNNLVNDVLTVIRRDVRGFGTTAGIFFQLDAAPDAARFPSVRTSVDRTSPVFLIGVGSQAPDYLRRYPVSVDFQADGGPYGARNLLSLLPLQGVPLREETLYAAVVLRGLGDAGGSPLGVPLAMAQLVAGIQPAGMSSAAFGEHRRALDALRADGVALSEVAGIAVFKTGRPTQGLETMRQEVLARSAPQPVTPPALVETHTHYSVYRTTIRMPVYQGGAPPFTSGGGEWRFDASGRPQLQGQEEANLFITIPHGAIPAGGFPAVVMIRTGLGSGLKAIVDRGAHPALGAPAAPGSGPAMEFARSGYVGIQVDGPHGGRRNITNGDEQFLMFNPTNPAAMRDNVRQSALELVLLAEVLPNLSIATRAGQVRIDASKLVLFGHSMGATIAPLVLAAQPRYGAAILSGAGGSWIENLVHKRSPVPTRPLAELLLDYVPLQRSLHTHDPVLSLIQWAGEPADPPVYARYVTQEPRLGSPRHVLMLQGIVDTYILPSIANATSLSLGLDLAGPSFDAVNPLLTQFTPFRDLAGLVGSREIGFPVQGNKTSGSGSITAVVVQIPEDGIEDGHEVAFQVEAAKARYRTFLRTFLQGTPQVP